MKVKDIFEFLSENHIYTEEYFYKNPGTFPVFSATLDAPVGYINNYEYNNPCILVVNYGTAGKTRLINDQYYSIGRNVCGLIIKKEYKDVLLLEYAQQILDKIFCVMVKEGNMGCLSQDALRQFEFPYPFPAIKEQEKYIMLMHSLYSYKDKCNLILKKIDKVQKQQISLPHSDSFQGINVPVSEIFECSSGNSGLTEEFIYKNQYVEGIKCRVLSSSTGEDTEMGMLSANVIINNKPIKCLLDNEGILVARNGDAGVITYLPKGNYVMNDHAYFISVKKNCIYNMNVKWIFIHAKELFKKYSSGNGNATWSKSAFFNSAKIDIPSRKYQDDVVELYEKVEEIGYKCNKIKQKIQQIV